MKKMGRKNNFGKTVAFTLVMALLLSLIGTGAGLAGKTGNGNVYAAAGEIQVNVRIEGYDNTFLPNTLVTLPEGATAWDAVNTVAAETGIDIVTNVNWGYIESISKGEIVWAEKDPLFNPLVGSNYSGWTYRINNLMPSVGIKTQSIEDGDTVTVAFSAYGDYGYFENSQYYGVENAPLNIKLNKDSWGTVTPLQGAQIYAYGDGAAVESPLGTTGSEGIASLTFETPGEYEITGANFISDYLVTGDVNTITRPYTKITIISAEEMNQKVDSDAADLSISYNGTDSVITLPTKGASGASISWTSDKPEVVSSTGQVKRPVCGTADAVVTLTAVIGDARYSRTKEIPVQVNVYTEAEVEAALNAMQSWELPGAVITSSPIWAATMSQDNQIRFIWTSSNPDVVSENQGSWGDLPVYQPDFGEASIPVTLTASAVSGTITKTRVFNVVVMPLDNGAKIQEINTLIEGIVDDVADNNIITNHMSYGSEWIQAMVSSGNADRISEIDRNNYLAMAMEEANSDRTNIGKIGKLVVGLTAMGIDPRNIPGIESGESVDLVEKIYTSGPGLGFGDQYTIPYVLMAYNLNFNPVGADRNQVIEQTINKMAEIEGGTIENPVFYNAWSADSIGIFAAVLSPYYATNTTAQGIVDRGLLWLKANQNSGTFGNANSDAMVVLGLSPLMENSAVKADSENFLQMIGNSLLDYKTETNNGFESWGSYNLLATVQGFQAVTGYKNHLADAGASAYIFDYPTAGLDNTVTWPKEKFPLDITVTPPTNTSFNKGTYVDTSGLDFTVTAAYLDGSSEIIPNSLCQVSSLDTSTTGAKEVRVTYLGKTKTFTIIVKDSDVQTVTKQVSITIKGTDVVNSSAVINSNSSVLSVLEEICALENIELVSYKGYVSSMNGREEFEEGPNSGWLYQVNGNTPSSTAAGEYKLAGGEKIVWYYTNDFTKDASSSAWVNENQNVTGGAITGSAVEVTFNDISGHWAKEYIEYLATRGIIKGMGSGLFMPDGTVTRAEFITILGNKAGADFAGYSGLPFKDVKSSDWFAGAVAWAAEQGIVTGADGEFKPNNPVSRQEMAVMLDRYMTKIEKTSAKGTGNPIEFADEYLIADYAKASVDKMQLLGIINGKTSVTFAPKDTATRAEAAKMLAIFMQIPAV